MRALARARSALGAGFRLHGRDPASGLDCVGLVGFAWAVTVPGGYALRSAPQGRIAEELARAGFAPRSSGAVGAVVLMAPGPGQLHLAIGNGAGGIVHADAIARRVVERGAPLPWPVLGAWMGGD